MAFKYRLPKIDIESIRKIIGHFAPHLKPFKGKIILSGIMLLGVSLMTLLRPWPLKVVFDYVLNTDKSFSDMSFLQIFNQWGPFGIIVASGIAILVIAVLNGLFEYTQNILAKTAGHGLTASIRLQLFSHIQGLPQSYHDYRETGELLTSLTGDINLLQDLLVETLIRLTGQFVIIFGMLGVAFYLDWQLALLIVAVTPFFVIASFKYSGQIKRAANKQRERYGQLVTSMQESLSGISQIKVFAQEKLREKLIGKTISSDFRAGLKTTRLAAAYTRTIDIIAAAGTALVLIIGAKKALDGTISPGDLIIFITYLRGIYRPVRKVADLSARIAKSVARGEKIIEILELQPEIIDSENAISAKKVKGDIRFENVSFSYRQGEPVLKNVTLHIPQGKTTAVIGSTGVGKSTIAKLILRLYKPTGGRILIDDRDISDYRIRSLRKRISNLSQDTFLFRMSIGENIGFGKRNATQEEIEQAAELAGADVFINSFPNGYDTLVGEGGLTLSGGQRQKISFARAALRNSSMMIFDEPATGLDIHAEKEALLALSSFKQDHTIFIITHRLKFLELADWIIFIENGSTVEQGKPSELLSNKSGFYSFVEDEIIKGGKTNWAEKIMSDIRNE